MQNPFKIARMEAKIKQNDMAKLLGIGRTQVANIENNYSIPSTRVLLSYIIILKVSPIDIYKYYFANVN